MASIWDLLPPSAWSVQPVLWPTDPMQPPPGAQQAAAQAPTQAFGWAATSANPTSAPAFGWASVPPAPASAPAYSGATDPEGFLGSSPGASILDPARSAQMLRDAQRAHAFAMWWSGPPSRRRAQQVRGDRPDRVAAPDAWPYRNAIALSGDAPGAFANNAAAPVIGDADADALATPTRPRVPNSYLSELAGYPVYLPAPRPAAPAASQPDEWKLTNNASWDPRTWSATDNPLAWLHLDYERRYPEQAARLKRMPMGGDIPAFDAPTAAQGIREGWAAGYGDRPVLYDPAPLAGIPAWIRRPALSSVDAVDQTLRGVSGAVHALAGAAAGTAEDLGVIGPGEAGSLARDLVIMSQFPGNPELALARGGLPRAPPSQPPAIPALAAPPVERLAPPPAPVEPLVPRAPNEAGSVRIEPPAGTLAGPREPTVGRAEIEEFRSRIGVPTRHTVAVARTNVPGFEDVMFEGASPKVLKEARLPPATEGNFKSPSPLARGLGHAEEVLFNEFDRAVEKRGLRPSDIEGKFVIHVSNPYGVCTWCLAGLSNRNAPAGVIKQFSMKYPKLTIEFSVDTQPGIRTIGPSRFGVLNGTYLDWSKP
jgi:hypothetical protein